MLLSELFDYHSIYLEEEEEEEEKMSVLQPQQPQQESQEPAGMNSSEEDLEVLRELEELADGYDYFICETQLLHKSISVSQVTAFIHCDD